VRSTLSLVVLPCFVRAEKHGQARVTDRVRRTWATENRPPVCASRSTCIRSSCRR